jgi:putative hemolysin
MLFELSVILALVLVNGLLAAAEIAIVGVDKLSLQRLAEKSEKRARAVEALRKDPERFFATVQIGITVIGATTGAIGGSSFARKLEPFLLAMPAFIASHARGLSLTLVVALVSFLSLVLGELVPKSLGLRYAGVYAVVIAPVVLGLSRATRPFVWFLTACSNAVLRLFGDHTTFTESRVSPEDVLNVVGEAAESGTIHPAAAEISTRALEFVNTSVGRVMVPRSRIAAIPRNADAKTIKRIALEHGFSRFPVYGKDLDDIVGYVLVKDMLAIAWEHELVVLEDLIRPPWVVSEMSRAPEVLKQMQDERVHLAVVVDEHGGTAGIVTIEDLIEEIVGEITSELAEPEPLSVRLQPDGSALARGDASVRDVNRELDLALPEGDSYSTLGGLCSVLAGHLPREKEELWSPDGTRLVVEKATPRAVLEVRICREQSDDFSAPEPQMGE